MAIVKIKCSRLLLGSGCCTKVGGVQWTQEMEAQIEVSLALSCLIGAQGGVCGLEEIKI